VPPSHPAKKGASNGYRRSGGREEKRGGKRERRQARHRREQQEGRRGATASTSNPPSRSPGPIRSPAEAAIKIGQNGKVRFNRVVPSPASLQTYRVHRSWIKAGFQRENAAAENQRPAPARHPYSAKAPTTTNPRKDQPSVPKRKCRKSVRLQPKQTAEKPRGRTGQVQQGDKDLPSPTSSPRRSAPLLLPRGSQRQEFMPSVPTCHQKG